MEKSSTDIWFIAYLMHRSMKIQRFEKIGKNRVRCYFNISEEDWNKFRLEFNNSDFIAFKTLVEQVKDLSY